MKPTTRPARMIVSMVAPSARTFSSAISDILAVDDDFVPITGRYLLQGVRHEVLGLLAGMVHRRALEPHTPLTPIEPQMRCLAWGDPVGTGAPLRVDGILQLRSRPAANIEPGSLNRPGDRVLQPSCRIQAPRRSTSRPPVDC